MKKWQNGMTYKKLLKLVQLSETQDTAIWALEASGKFSTKSLYRFMKNSGQIDFRMTEI